MTEEVRSAVEMYLHDELERIAEELGGVLHEQLVLDSTGRESRKVIITYPIQ